MTSSCSWVRTRRPEVWEEPPWSRNVQTELGAWQLFIISCSSLGRADIWIIYFEWRQFNKIIPDFSCRPWYPQDRDLGRQVTSEFGNKNNSPVKLQYMPRPPTRHWLRLSWQVWGLIEFSSVRSVVRRAGAAWLVITIPSLGHREDDQSGQQTDICRQIEGRGERNVITLLLWRHRSINSYRKENKNIFFLTF